MGTYTIYDLKTGQILARQQAVDQAAAEAALAEDEAAAPMPEAGRWAVYDTTSGAIRAVVMAGTQADAQAECGTGQALAALPDGDDTTHTVDPETGEAVAIAP